MYFERLALNEKVHKENRDVYASVCLMLAVKYNEDKDTMAENLKVSVCVCVCVCVYAYVYVCVSVSE